MNVLKEMLVNYHSYSIICIIVSKIHSAIPYYFRHR